jgi:NAD(P)-dependent dehydrogenase (short-subunit alcohol dehydrogenase family)
MSIAGWFAPLNPPVAQWSGRRVWVVGASSGIGRATASALHSRGATVLVSARSTAALAEFIAEHAGAQSHPLDVTNPAQVRVAAAAVLRGGPLDLVLYCAGHYRETTAAAFDVGDMLRHQAVNYAGALHVLDAVLPALLREGHGHISLVGSVAGYRGLPRSLGYGPTKAALINLAQALYLELGARGIGVSIVNPGFVETPLTAQNRFAMPALIGPAEAAHDILRGWARGAFEIHFPRRFTWPMKLLALLPFRAYQALVRRGTRL